MLLRVSSIVSIFAVCACAQEFRGTITGKVMDAQQAVVPAVKIIAVQAETGAKYQTTSGHDGSYALPFVAPGLYSVSAEAAGFKRSRRDGVRVSTNERLSLDIQLEIGQVSD